MPIELRNVPGLPEPEGYSHLSIATGERIVHIAGQVGRGDDGELAEGLGAQAATALRNVQRALEVAGMTESDLVKITLYVRDWDPSKVEELFGGLMAASSESSPDVPVTLIGVQSLFEPGMLIEIEAVAIA